MLNRSDLGHTGCVSPAACAQSRAPTRPSSSYVFVPKLVFFPQGFGDYSGLQRTEDSGL